MSLPAGRAVDKDAILEKVANLLRDVLDIDDLVVSRHLTATDVPEWDSLAHIRIVVAAEKAFALRFSAADISDLKSVGEFVDLIHAQLSS